MPRIGSFSGPHLPPPALTDSSEGVICPIRGTLARCRQLPRGHWRWPPRYRIVGTIYRHAVLTVQSRLPPARMADRDITTSRQPPPGHAQDATPPIPASRPTARCRGKSRPRDSSSSGRSATATRSVIELTRRTTRSLGNRSDHRHDTLRGRPITDESASGEARTLRSAFVAARHVVHLQVDNDRHPR